jgi:hypothetical protein
MPRDKGRKRVGVAVDVRTQQGCIVEGCIVEGCIVEGCIVGGCMVEGTVLRPALDQVSTSTS